MTPGKRIPTLDSNVLIYARLEPESAKGLVAARLIRDCAPRGILAAQALGELLAVVRRRQAEQLADTVGEIALYRRVFKIAPTTPDTVIAAGGLSLRHGLQIWDAIIWSAAAALGASLLLSQDMQDGLTLDGMLVLNPFAPVNEERIRSLISA